MIKDNTFYGIIFFLFVTLILKNEYNVDIVRTDLPYRYIRWIENEEIDLNKLNLSSDTKKIQDLKGQFLLLFTNEWGIRWAEKNNPELKLEEFGR